VNKEGKDVYILGDSTTAITPVMVATDDGKPDYVALVFSNGDEVLQPGEVIALNDADLVLGFRTEHSVDLLISKLLYIRENYLNQKEEENEQGRD
jgi:hypothetical protein